MSDWVAFVRSSAFPGASLTTNWSYEMKFTPAFTRFSRYWLSICSRGDTAGGIGDVEEYSSSAVNSDL